MALPLIESTVTFGRSPSFAYGSDNPAILTGDFGPVNSQYVVCSKRLAVDIFNKNRDYDAEHLARGLKDGWLRLIFNPTIYDSASNKLTAIRAVKTVDPVDAGWFRLLIIPQWGRRR
jgi:hypothetical protein